MERETVPGLKSPSIPSCLVSFSHLISLLPLLFKNLNNHLPTPNPPRLRHLRTEQALLPLTLLLRPLPHNLIISLDPGEDIAAPRVRGRRCPYTTEYSAFSRLRAVVARAGLPTTGGAERVDCSGGGVGCRRRCGLTGSFHDRDWGCRYQGGGEGVCCVQEEVGGQRVVATRLALRLRGKLPRNRSWVVNHR